MSVIKTRADVIAWLHGRGYDDKQITDIVGDEPWDEDERVIFPHLHVDAPVDICTDDCE